MSDIITKMDTANKELLNIENLSFSYKRSYAKALDSINITVSKGDFVAVLGKSGAGKSSLMLSLNGLIPHFIKGNFDGTVFVNGTATTQTSVADISNIVGIIFQDFESQLFSTSVELEIAFGLENIGIERSEIKERINKYLKLAGLAGFNSREPALLSGGEKQRLAIAAVLAMEPQLICLDEPTTDLDPEGKSAVFELLGSLRKDKGRAIIAVEHESDEIINADRCIVLDNGKIILDGKPGHIFKDTSRIAQLGIMPPQLASLANIMNADSPFRSVKEAYRYSVDNGFYLDISETGIIAAADTAFERCDGECVLKMEEVSFTYDKAERPSLNDINLTVKQGEIIAIAGKNGSGKTTLAKHMNGLLKKTSGEIILDGKNIDEYRPVEIVQKAGFVFQNPDYQIFSETVEEEVSFTPKLLNLGNDEIKKRVDDSLRAVGLEENRRDDPFVLTKGQRQRIAVASVLAARSGIIILDEPTTGLDFTELTGMMDLLLTLNRKGHTIIMVTHSMHVITKYAKRLIIMQDGKIAFDGPTRKAMQQADLLKECHMKRPAVVELSSQIGGTLLNIEEFEKALKRK